MQNLVYKSGLDAEIIELFRQSFTDAEGETEGGLVSDLVKRLLFDTPKEERCIFISIESKEVCAAVVFSKLQFSVSYPETWLLSPAAVASAKQGFGLGKDLIRFAHRYLVKMGVVQVISYGDIKFYSKVGYYPISETLIPAPLTLTYPEGWIGQSLVGENMVPLKGKSFCTPALHFPELW